jgi:hypothetical protein
MDIITALIIVNVYLWLWKKAYEWEFDTVSKFEMPIELQIDQIPFYVDGKFRCYMSIGG